ncbi:hypothetical protein A3A39_00645 [Candidatus Kaiserbacteria bacterium RIFCSPLOWO2_01_FULL_54_13]|uniref:Serine protease n=1 Tax=Candidatus Kaiserbacteria bacterium RIFCSPLOWO2_01_FULL_54_13 TaxID=1798512 RepID=A0A1F6EZT0_9BACT|nr:MAG: hypothetical protein A3A39_00645 [Candidatus Kaiserbacteria bacterium RIFCSPLOWO2_01_FULL_54_13]
MPAHIRILMSYIGALGIIVGALLILINAERLSSPTPTDEGVGQIANAAAAQPSLEIHPSLPETVQEERALHPLPPVKTTGGPAPSPVPPANTEQVAYVARIPNPYPFPPESFSAINEKTRAALVNILCTSDGVSLQPISGSGIIIDPRGIILTNAHVAQYVLLAQSSETNLSCVIRSGAPARAFWRTEVLYIPPIWIQEHAADITNAAPTGTGEHDYALLRITGLLESLDLSPAALNIHALPFDVREGIGFRDDFVLIASYPAEFVGAAAQFSLYPVSSIAPIKELLTFEASTVDLVSLGGVVEAQSGSSGGPVVNAWGHVIGIITTTSEGATTAERELRAITMTYVNHDLSLQTGDDLITILGSDVATRANEFSTKQAPALVRLLIDNISDR